MPKTVMAYDGGLYHTACLPDEAAEGTAKLVKSDELDDDQICDECMNPLVGDEAPEDPDPSAEDEKDVQAP